MKICTKHDCTITCPHISQLQDGAAETMSLESVNQESAAKVIIHLEP